VEPVAASTTSVEAGPIAGPPSLRAFRLLDGALRQGRYLAGERLPPERDLARQLGISRTSLRQALTALAESGRVRAAANRGWYALGAPISEGPNGFLSFTDSARDRGLTAGARILAQRVRPATLDEADILGLPPTAPMLDLERLRCLDGVPICVSHDRMPVARVAALVDLDLTDRSLTVELEQRCGLVATRCAYEVESVPCDARLAALLAVTPAARQGVHRRARTPPRTRSAWRPGRSVAPAPRSASGP